MILFVNTIWKKAYLWLFDNKKNLLSETFFEIKWNESSLLLPKLEEFLEKNNVDYFQIENFVLVNWPGSFTWVRTAVLTINTINFITKKNITPLSYFDLFKSFPIIKSSSKRDSFFQKDNKRVSRRKKYFKNKLRCRNRKNRNSWKYWLLWYNKKYRIQRF